MKWEILYTDRTGGVSIKNNIFVPTMSSVPYLLSSCESCTIEKLELSTSTCKDFVNVTLSSTNILLLFCFLVNYSFNKYHNYNKNKTKHFRFSNLHLTRNDLVKYKYDKTMEE